ncbi:MAG: adenylate/guanylate cyclase domain-containing protein, partial [Bacteroidota bacterium]
MSQSRQLTAIMFADIMGYTALMQDDETFAMQLRYKFKTNLEEEVNAHFGRILEFRGDGAMCCFNSTIEAVKAALKLQVTMQTEPTVPLRIGMHTGDVIFEENNIYGDGVNIASRMESFALAGSILISGKAYDDIKNQKDIKAVSLGKYILKNVKEPVEIFAISHPGIITPDSTSLHGKGEKVIEKKSVEKSIAVMPFVNMSNDPEQEYFSDGVTEEILNSLAHLKDLRVAARTSSFYFKGKNIDLREIGNKLNVRTVLEGSIRKQGNKLRVTAQLINVEDGFHLWSERYDKNMDDLFTIQDEIALAITEKLKITLLEEEREILYQKPTENKEAYDLYLKGRFYINKRGPSINKGLQYFQQAADIDPSFTLAYVGIADAYAILAFYGMMHPHEAMPKAKIFAEKALQLNPLLAEAFTTLAFITTFYDWNWAEAKIQFLDIFKINSNYALAHYWYSYFLSIIEGNNDEAIKVAKKAVEVLEPLVPISHHVLSIMYINAGKFEDAITESKIAIELDPNSFPGYRGLGIGLAGLNQYDKAIEALKSAVLFSARHPWSLVELSWVYYLNKNETETKRILDELLFRSESEYISGLFLCGAAFFNKDIEKAFQFLDKAFEERDGSLPFINVWPLCSFMRTDPRFKPYLSKLNFPE